MELQRIEVFSSIRCDVRTECGRRFNPCYLGAADKMCANATLVCTHENFCSVSVVTSSTTVAPHALWQRSQPKKSAADEHGESRATLQTVKKFLSPTPTGLAENISEYQL